MSFIQRCGGNVLYTEVVLLHLAGGCGTEANKENFWNPGEETFEHNRNTVFMKSADAVKFATGIPKSVEIVESVIIKLFFFSHTSR